MKKIICLLLLVLSFAACKKDDESSVVDPKKDDDSALSWEKKVWRAEGWEIYKYDAEGKELNLLEINHDPFVMIFDHKIKAAAYIHHSLVYPAPFFYLYTYENNCITFDLKDPHLVDAEMKCKITKLTDNEMIWRDEHYGRKYRNVWIAKLRKVEIDKIGNEKPTMNGLWKLNTVDIDNYDAEGKLTGHKTPKPAREILYIDDDRVTIIYPPQLLNDNKTSFSQSDTYNYTVDINNILKLTQPALYPGKICKTYQIMGITADNMAWLWRNREDIGTSRYIRIKDLNDL